MKAEPSRMIPLKPIENVELFIDQVFCKRITLRIIIYV